MAAEPDLTYAGRVRRRKHDGWDSGPQKKLPNARRAKHRLPHHESMFYRFWGFPLSFYKVSIDFLTLNRPNA